MLKIPVYKIVGRVSRDWLFIYFITKLYMPENYFKKNNNKQKKIVCVWG